MTKGSTSYTWTRGRLLASVGNTTFAYDYKGRRTKKGTTEYYYDGDRLIAEVRSNNTLYYFYDAKGVCGFRYNGKDYEYIKNLFGDIVGIAQGVTLVARYEYDIWGNCTVAYDPEGIGTINPFRYRGYYFDTESGLYYLMSRYYDPEIGQFISPDTMQALQPKVIGGLDLYAYCRNNPVRYSNHRMQGGSGVSSVSPTVSAGSSNSSGIDPSVLHHMMENFSGYSSWRTHVTSKLVDFDGVSISYTRTRVIRNTSSIFYGFADAGIADLKGGTAFDSTDASIGIGMNLGNWYVAELFYTSNFGYGTSLQITPYLSSNSVISMDGISLGLGYIDLKGDNHTYSLNADWLTIGKVAVALYLATTVCDEIAVLGSVLVKLLVGA